MERYGTGIFSCLGDLLLAVDPQWIDGSGRFLNFASRLTFSDSFCYYTFLLLCFVLPRDEPPLILLGAPVVGPGTGFIPTP